MTTETTRHPRPPTVVAGGIIIALGALSNVATLATPLPVPVIVIGVFLAAAAAAALVGIWLEKSWGRWLGVVTLGGTIVIAAPGIVSAPSRGVASLAIGTAGMAAIGVIVLLLPTSTVERSAP